MFNCAHIKRLTFLRRKFFKIVVAESGESVTSIFFADIGSHSRLLSKVLVDVLPVPWNTGFFLFDFLFSELTLRVDLIKYGIK